MFKPNITLNFYPYSCIQLWFLTDEIPFLTDGGWTEWSEWDNCTLACGGGNQTRTRTCDNPPPEHKGEDCGADNSETQACNIDPCPIGKITNIIN